MKGKTKKLPTGSLICFDMTNYRFKNSEKKIRIGKIIGLARTYREHAAEMQTKITEEPLLFLKPESAVIFNNETIRIPTMSSSLHHEVELGVVMGKTARHISQTHALDYVLGYVVVLDITARDIQSDAKKKGWPWTIAKGFDTFAPISDMVLKDEILDPNDLDLVLTVNNQVKQQSNTKYMVYSVERIIEFVSCVMTLKRGDLIMTGTPSGVGEIVDGDVLEARLGDYCVLSVDVRKSME
ncbi:MAG: fumarylacetoacetate hydrolase family protein [Euryarchaeota archaeon]|nr:fumarylacetoacetate hydrolase family protein [Euryarchaeota archaeon]